VVDVPVAPGSPGAEKATPIAVPAPPGWGGPPAVAAPPRPALPPAPVLAAPGLPAIPGPYRTQPRGSLADMANAQLRRDKKDPLAQDVQDAGRDDCLHASDKPGMTGGLLKAPVVALKALTGNCPK
jgi:hypothetical protein